MPPAPPRSESDILAALIGDIDRHLARTVRSLGLPEILEEAICYAVLDSGKRLRPALVLLCAEAVGGNRNAGLAPAVAMELIHNFSLVHDDLPAMDDDAIRRGRPTLHVQAGEAMATLAGDAMISSAFLLVARSGLTAERVVAIVEALATATTAMISGQVYDTVGGLPPDLDPEQQLRLLHRNKTGALLQASCRIGGICGEADAEAFVSLDRYGAAIGLMFQIVDDLLDVTQSSEHLGKAAGKDLSAGKLTFPGVHGVARSREEVDRLTAEAISSLEAFGREAEPLRALCRDMAVRTK